MRLLAVQASAPHVPPPPALPTHALSRLLSLRASSPTAAKGTTRELLTGSRVSVGGQPWQARRGLSVAEPSGSCPPSEPPEVNTVCQQQRTARRGSGGLPQQQRTVLHIATAGHTYL